MLTSKLATFFSHYRLASLLFTNPLSRLPSFSCIQPLSLLPSLARTRLPFLLCASCLALSASPSPVFQDLKLSLIFSSFARLELHFSALMQRRICLSVWRPCPCPAGCRFIWFFRLSWLVCLRLMVSVCLSLKFVALILSFVADIQSATATMNATKAC